MDVTLEMDGLCGGQSVETVPTMHQSRLCQCGPSFLYVPGVCVVDPAGLGLWLVTLVIRQHCIHRTFRVLLFAGDSLLAVGSQAAVGQSYSHSF